MGAEKKNHISSNALVNFIICKKQFLVAEANIAQRKLSGGAAGGEWLVYTFCDLSSWSTHMCRPLKHRLNLKKVENSTGVKGKALEDQLKTFATNWRSHLSSIYVLLCCKAWQKFPTPHIFNFLFLPLKMSIASDVREEEQSERDCVFFQR